MHIFSNEFLPHEGLAADAATRKKKAHCLGYVLRKLTLVYRGLLPTDDRDHYAFKRIECVGGLMSLLFRQLFRTFLRSLNMQIYKKADAEKDPELQ